MRVKLNSLNVTTLKGLLNQHGLQTGGIKSELIERLKDFLGTDEIEKPGTNTNADVQNQINELKLMMGRFTVMLQNLTDQRSNAQNTVVQNQTSPVNVVLNQTSPVTPSSTVTVAEEPEQSQRPRVNQSTREYSIREIAETIPFFDPTDRNSLSVERFVDRVRNISTTHQFDEKALLLAVYSRLKGVARMWLDARPECFSDWNTFAEALVSEFYEDLDETAIHDIMSKATRRQDEPPNDYCFRIIALGRKHGLSDRAIIKHARAGMRNREFQSAIAPMSFDSLSNFRQTVNEFFDNYIAPNNRSMFKQTISDTVERNTKMKYQQADKNKIVCYNCQEEGHISSKCNKPPRRPRCKDCSKVHAKGEPVNCGKAMTVRKVEKQVEIFPKKTVQINNIDIIAGVDTGSECDLMKKTVADNLNFERKYCQTKITGIGGGTRNITEYMDLPVLIDEFTTNLKFYIVDDNLIDTDILIGQPIFRDKNITATIQRGYTVFTLAKTSEREINKQRIGQAEVNCSVEETEVVEELMDLINEYRDIFSTNVSEIGKTDWETMKIKLTSDKPIAQTPYRIPEKKKQAVAEMINDLLQNDIIEKSVSSYASPIILHKKKDGSDRLCIDYRRLNAITEPEVYPMPSIEEALHEAKQYKYFTMLDLNSGYYQVPIEEESRKLTAFCTTEGLFQFKRSAFGLRNAPTVFLRLMSKIKERLRPGDMIHYMDDMLVGSRTIPEMMQKLRRVFNVLRDANLTLNVKKCEFMKRTITYLGHELTPDGISPGKIKTKAIDDFPTPGNVGDVRRFLGLSGYFRKFVPGYAIRTEPLRMLLRKGQEFHWDESENNAFVDIKRALTTTPVMTAYRSMAEHAIHSDASKAGLASVLMQLEDDVWKPVIYYSRSTTDLERKFHSSELETLAVVESLERFKYYVYGRPVKVLTDCNAVKGTLSKRDVVPRIGRWSLRIQEFDVNIEHRPGKRMEHVDCLSRAPVSEALDLEEATLRIDRVDLHEYDWLSALQIADHKIQAQIAELKKSKVAENDEFIVVDNRLFKKLDGKQLWVVPKNLRFKILHDCHDNAGHLALENTLSRIKKTMWFDRMRNYAKSYIKSCIECAYNKHNGGQGEGEYHCDEIPTVPFNTIHLDHLGPFPRSKTRNEHLLVLVDAFTKFTIARPVPSTKSKYVVKILNEFNSYFGTPERIITDRGTAFTSKEFENYCKNHGIKHIKNAVRTPRANGHAERTNRTILSMLLTSCEKDKNWDEQIPQIQWSLNTLRNKTTQKTPQELLYAFTPRDITKNKLILALHDNVVPTQDELEEIRQRTARRINAERQKAKAKYDAKKKPTTKFETGDLVLVENEPTATGTSRKLEPRYKGPFLITAVLGHDRYVVEDIPGSKRNQKHYTSVYASDKMKRFEPVPMTEDSASEEEDFDEDVNITGTAEL